MTTPSLPSPSIQPAVRPRSPWHTTVRVVFALWVVGFVVVGGYLLSSHLLTLPTPDPDDLGPQHSAIAERQASQRGQWFAVHVLDQDCPCSLRVLSHLLAGPRPAQIVERVVLIAGEVAADRAAAIRAAGFDLDIVAPDQLVERYRVEAAPLLVVFDPADAVRYVGGYGPRKQAADIRDVAVIEALRRGERVAAQPTFGCAVGRSLRTKIDPLGVRNWK
jgi:hypothetical protein